MGFEEAGMPFVFFVISIIGIALTAINVKTYLDTNKEKDTNFKFSVTILVISILSLIGSGIFMFKAFKGDAPAGAQAGSTSAAEVAGSKTNIEAPKASLQNKLKLIAAQATGRAHVATEAANTVGELKAQLGNLKQA